jgi:hypothetical protein
MKLKEFIKKYYGSSKDITTRSKEITNTYKELILPGSYRSEMDFRKTLAWNLDRELYFREATQENNSAEIYVTLTTGHLDLYVIFENEDEFQGYLDCGLKKHRKYRKENITYDPSRKYLFYSRKYE